MQGAELARVPGHARSVATSATFEIATNFQILKEETSEGKLL